MSASGSVLHAYGVVPADSDVRLPVSGVDGARVETLPAGELLALVSPLDAARYGEEVWRAHAEDPEWLAGFALEHQEVLSAVATTTDVLPFRIPGMYADRDALVATVAAEREVLLSSLETVRGHVEWGVKVFWDSASEAAEATEAAEAPVSGQDYLRRRAEQLGAKERGAEERRRLVVAAYEHLAEEVSQSVTSPPQDPALTRRAEPMLLNSAHLVRRDREDPFFSLLADLSRELAPAGLVVEVSGPWPPYSFVGGRHRREEAGS